MSSDLWRSSLQVHRWNAITCGPGYPSEPCTRRKDERPARRGGCAIPFNARSTPDFRAVLKPLYRALTPHNRPVRMNQNGTVVYGLAASAAGLFGCVGFEFWKVG